SDICVTSGNAAKVVSSLQDDTVIFLPDEFLGKNVARETGRDWVVADLKQPAAAKSKKARLILWPGRCEVHEQFVPQDIRAARRQFPNVKVLAHPECPPEVTA